jgi:preprotein translocase subunit SecD
MNRFPLWKNALVLVALILGLIYTLPNFFGEAPAVQVSTARTGVTIDADLMSRVESSLKEAAISHSGLTLDTTGVRVRLADTDTQLKTRDLLEKTLNPDAADAKYVVALNLLSKSPDWLRSFGALPMYLGLDLRGGVHFLLQIDMQGAMTKRLDSMASDLRTQLREKNIRHGGIAREGDAIALRFRDSAGLEAARGAIETALPEMDWITGTSGADITYAGRMKEVAAKDLRDSAIKQNILTLQKRVNELGVAEPIIQQQGADRIVVQLPGVQDVAKAKDLIGRTATLEVRLVDQEAMISGNMEGREVYPENTRGGLVSQVPVQKTVILTGERFETAQAAFDDSNRPAVAVKLDQTGGRIMRTVTRENLKKLMVILLFEKGRGEAISVATIQGEFGDRFQITGQFSPQETNTLAILIRSGALAAPMEIIEERVIGPSLGAENIQKGFDSTLWGFVAIAVFMIALLHGVRLHFDCRAGRQPAVPDRTAVAAAGHADPAGHRGHRADAGHGDRRQRADQRTDTRRTAQRRDAAGGDFGRLRTSMGDHSRFEHHDADRRSGAAHLRLGPGARLRRGALPRHPDLDVQCSGGVTRHGESGLRSCPQTRVRLDRYRVETGRRRLNPFLES